MARLAILTDIHGNREAFQAVLDDLHQRAVDRIVLLGDIVGYGPDPEWCANKAMALHASGALVVKGNHDAAIEKIDVTMNAVARTAIDWTRPRLGRAEQAFLNQMPLTEAVDDLLFVHASANDPGDWIYVTSERSAMPGFRVSKARVIFCGHVHVPLLVSCDRQGMVREQPFRSGLPIPLIRSRRWLAVVGSAGQPRDGVAQAAWALVDTGRDELTFRRTPYDAAGAARKVRAAGLPEELAVRLLMGR